jgi:hypothetical protein
MRPRQQTPKSICLLGVGALLPPSCATVAPPMSAQPLSTAAPTPLSAAQVEAVVRAKIPEMKTCFAKLRRDPFGPSGTLVMQWKIDGDGSVHDVKVARSDFGNAATQEISNCLALQVQEFSFPASQSSEHLLVTFPFSISGRAAQER